MSPLLAETASRLTPFQWSNVVNGDGVNGIAVAITGISIVFAALAVISLFIWVLPKALDFVEPYLPSAHHHGAPAPAQSLPEDQKKIIAAISVVLHSEMQKAMKE